jgi:DNA ligase (NAD+)
VSNPFLSKIAERGIKDAWLKSNPIKPTTKPITAEQSQCRAKIASIYRPIVKNLNDELEQYSISPELGGVAAQNTIDYFQSEAGKQVLGKLSLLGINPLSENYAPASSSNTGKLVGKIFVITGTLSEPREHFQNLIESHGGKVSSSVTSKTDFLLAGENAGSKAKKAEELGVKKLTEDDLTKILF